MRNIEKYQETFAKALQIEDDQIEGLEYQSVSSWDSVGHMELIAELEDVFDIMFDTEDIIDFSSYKKGIEILGKYGVEI